MEAKELSEIHNLLKELFEAIKEYDKCNEGHNGNRVVYLLSTLWENENFSGSRFSEYIEKLTKEPFYVNRIAAYIRKLLSLGIDDISMEKERRFYNVKYYFPFIDDYGEECRVYDYTYDYRRKMFNEIHHTAKEILDIYNYEFPNSRADNTESNKKDAEELTEREIKYYGKAIEAGMAKKTEQGYKWLGLNVSLGYFINKVHRPTATERLPYKRMEELWGVKRLDSAVHQSADRKHKWEKDIDALFEE